MLVSKSATSLTDKAVQFPLNSATRLLRGNNSDAPMVFKLNRYNILHYAKIVFLTTTFPLNFARDTSTDQKKKIFIERMTVSHFIDSDGYTSKLAPFQPQSTAEAATM